MNDCNKTEESPFPYQVAGHGALLKYSPGKICKPLIPIELQFYESLYKRSPTSLRSFTPTYYGTAELQFTNDQLNQWKKKVDESEKEEDGKGSFEDEQLHPWSAKVTKMSLTKLQKNGSTSHQYLILEDLTSKYHHPCVFDIKLGTRQHGDDAPPDKRKRHMMKVETTTSKPLGMRLCGQLVYDPQSKTYRHLDKYMGRKLTSETIPSAIAQFFNNGTHFRVDVLKRFIVRLKELQQAIEKESNYRFYSTSLLLLYEGDYDSEENKQVADIDLRMIDFAHTFPREQGQEQDDGYLFGLKNFIGMMENICREIPQ